MKKIYTIWVFILCVLFVGCSDDEGQPASTLQVLSTTAKFDAFGGEGKIEVQSASEITAVAEEDWCTVNVSGHTVNVGVPVNKTLLGRTTMVAITAGNQTLRVPVYQAGDAFTCDLIDYLFPAAGGNRTFSLKTTRDCTVTGLPEWLSYKIQDDEIVFTAAATDYDRSAQVTVACGKGSFVTATFSQWAVMQAEGTYTISYVNASGVASTGKAVITKNEDGTYSLVTEGMVLNTTIKAAYSEETRQMVISFGQMLGSVGNYVAYLCAFSEDAYLSWGTEIQYVSTGVFDENEKVKFTFEDNGTWSGKKVIGFYYAAFDKPIADGGTWQKVTWGRATNIVMMKQ